MAFWKHYKLWLEFQELNKGISWNLDHFKNQIYLYKRSLMTPEEIELEKEKEEVLSRQAHQSLLSMMSMRAELASYFDDWNEAHRDLAHGKSKYF